MIALAGKPVDEAKDLLTLVPAIWAIVTAWLLIPAWRLATEDEKYNLRRSAMAVVLSALSTIVGAIVVAVLTPLGYRVAFEKDGTVEGVLVLYEVFLLAVIALTISSFAVLVKSARHLRDVIKTR
ncbi:MAG: hypothetical protein QOI06_2860 [Nocardioidaceae bacterium]|jgi:hypothetical protein|nr:hypothetical protein [Nocardioidaceae bacterium]